LLYATTSQVNDFLAVMPFPDILLELKAKIVITHWLLLSRTDALVKNSGFVQLINKLYININFWS